MFLDAVNEVEAMGARRAQDLIEANALINFLHDRDCGRAKREIVYLEIGARHGWTFYLIAKLMKPAGMIAVDLPGVQPWGDDGSEKILRKVADAAHRLELRAELIIGDSRAQETIASVANALCVGPVDLLFIDGDHKYAGVKADWDNYRPFVRDGGFVVFHDIKPIHRPTREKHKVIEVDQLWAELKPQYEHWEILNDGSGMGLGVLRL